MVNCTHIGTRSHDNNICICHNDSMRSTYCENRIIIYYIPNINILKYYTYTSYTRIILYTRFTLKEPSHIARANFIATFRMIQIDPTYITIYRTGDVELSRWWSLPGRHYTFTWTKYASPPGSKLCWHYVYPKEMCKPLPSFF